MHTASRTKIFYCSSLTLSKPGSQPWEQKVEDKYIKSCLNLNPSFKISGDSSISRSGSHSEERGTESRSSRNTAESGSESPPSWHAIWSSDTVGNDVWWVRTGFHSASRPTSKDRVRARVRRVNSGESVEETRWTSKGLWFWGSMGRVMVF